MDEEMNVGELLKETAEENQTRKILEILNECKDIEERAVDLPKPPKLFKRIIHHKARERKR